MAGLSIFALIAALILLVAALATTPQITPAQATATYGAHEWKLQQDAILLNGGTK